MLDDYVLHWRIRTRREELSSSSGQAVLKRNAVGSGLSCLCKSNTTLGLDPSLLGCLLTNTLSLLGLADAELLADTELLDTLLLLTALISLSLLLKLSAAALLLDALAALLPLLFFSGSSSFLLSTCLLLLFVNFPPNA